MIIPMWDYPSNKDGFMGSENRRYWIHNTTTGNKIRITEQQYREITKGDDDLLMNSLMKMSKISLQRFCEGARKRAED